MIWNIGSDATAAVATVVDSYDTLIILYSYDSYVSIWVHMLYAWSCYLTWSHLTALTWIMANSDSEHAEHAKHPRILVDLVSVLVSRFHQCSLFTVFSPIGTFGLWTCDIGSQLSQPLIHLFHNARRKTQNPRLKDWSFGLMTFEYQSCVHGCWMWMLCWFCLFFI